MNIIKIASLTMYAFVVFLQNAVCTASSSLITATSSSHEHPVFTKIIPLDTVFDDLTVLRYCSTGMSIVCYERFPKRLDTMYSYLRTQYIGHESVDTLRIPNDSARGLSIVGIHPHGDSMFVVDLVKIMSFRKVSDRLWVLSRSFSLDHTYTYSALDGDSIRLWCDMSSSYEYDSTYVYSDVFYPKNGTMGKTQLFTNIKGVALQFMQPRNILGYSGSSSIISHVTSYDLTVQHHGKQYNLVRSPERWRTTPSRMFSDTGKIIPQRDFQFFNKIRRSSSTMCRVAWLSDSSIAVVWFTPALQDSSEYDLSLDLMLDVWTFSNDSWQLQLQDCVITQNYAVREDPNLPFDSFRISERALFAQGRIVDVRPYPSSVPGTAWTSMADHAAACEEYFLHHKLRYCIVEWRFP